MDKFEEGVYSCVVDENDIDQSPELIRVGGELVATTQYAGTDKEQEYLAKRIVLALNLVRGLSLEQMKEVFILQNKYNKALSVLKETRPYILDQSDWGNKYEARLLEEIDFVLDNK